MRTRIICLITLLVILLWFCGCTTPPKGGGGKSAGPYPPNYKDLILEYLRPRLFDPYSLRIERLDAPTINTIQRAGCLSPVKAGNDVWMGHIIYNAKNRLGGYVGFQHYVYLIQNGKLFELIPASLWNN